MPTYSTEEYLPYTAEQMFDLVADVESYPAFLPWCVAARVNERLEGGEVVIAQLVVRFKMFQERYTSRVELDWEKREISVSVIQGPFSHLQNEWKFTPQGEGVLVDFDIDFTFRSVILNKTIGIMFGDACKKMVDAFRKRADELYGSA